MIFAMKKKNIQKVASLISPAEARRSINNLLVRRDVCLQAGGHISSVFFKYGRRNILN